MGDVGMKNTEKMIRPQIRICRFCGRKTGRKMRICPEYGRLLRRDLQKPDLHDFLETDLEFGENMGITGGRKIMFETIYEEKEAG